MSSVSSLRDEIEQSNINKLEQVENITIERMKELETLAARISFDPRLTPSKISHGYYSREGIEELKKYKANSSIIEEVFIYYHQQENLYSSSGSYTVNTLMQNKYSFEDWDQEVFLKDLKTNLPFTKPVDEIVGNGNDEESIIAYFYPISRNNTRPYGTVLFFIRESSITDFMNTILGDFKGNAYVLNENDQIIASSVNDFTVTSESLNLSSWDEGEFGVESIEVNGKDYSLVTVRSQITGWTFITLMDANQFFERLSDTNILIVLLLLVMLIIGFVLSIVFGKNQYKPILNLVNSVSKKEYIKVDGENELDRIRKTISTVFEDQEVMNKTIDKQHPFAKDQFMTKMLKGDYKDEGEINSLAKLLNIEMKDGNYFVVIVYFENGSFSEETIGERDNIFNLLSDISLESVSAQGIDLLYSDAVVLVVTMDKIVVDVNKQQNQVIQKIQQFIQNETDLEPIIGVGEVYSNKSRINRSYIEALATLEYKYYYPKGSIIHFKEISTEVEHSLGYPKEEQMKLVQSIKQGDKDVAEETLLQLFENLASSDLSIHVLKAVCFDIINTVVKTISELGLTTPGDTFRKMVDFDRIEQLHKHLNLLVVETCKKVDNNKESHNIKLRNDIMKYIKANYHLFELSLEKIAIEFQLSVSYISRFIKDQSGVNFKQYVQQLRMEEVKRQLKTTDKPIKEIVVDVGYKDVANFTRKFKNEVGVTPGRYRDLNS
ncbi:helix-turn-helix domain-containing protein [Halalkalibacter kiskunsagensis]|uniref:Helix-turn-helix domain-containing protein n=1 Tax=Halalkalibacter kiskunsagensis TaxID=1548599 RepID=A0ABV6KB35_9BACI